MKTLFAIVIATLLASGCASSPEPQSTSAVRRAAGAAQIGVLYARSVYVDPINRPVSNLLSLSSLALKSATGLARRTTVNTALFAALEDVAVPPVAYAETMDLDRWERDLDRISGQKREKGHISFLVDGDEYFPRLVEAMTSASESIDMRTYIFDNDDFAVEIADLMKARSQDVDVRVQVDGLGNLLAMQTDAQSQPAGFDPPVSMNLYLEQGSRVKVRTRANPWLTSDHTKTTIIDNKVAFVGGMNIGREYRYDWHDLMMEVTGPVVDRLQHDSDKAWARAGILGDLGNILRFLSGKRKVAEAASYDVRPLYTQNFDSQIYRAQLAAIRRSKSYIFIENAYFSDDTILYELARARLRGVDVRVIIPSSGNHGALHASNQVAINRMLEHGIRVYIYPKMSHVKAAVFDGWACVGSANFDKLSLEINKEFNLATSEPKIVDQLLEQVFFPDLALSAEVSERVEVSPMHVMLEIAVDEFM